MGNEAHTFAESIVPFLGILRRKALRLEGCRSAAEDLVHDTVERALRNHASFCGGSNMAGWLSTIMYNLSMDRRRRERHETPLSPSMLVELTSPEADARSRWELVGRDEVDDAIGRLEPGTRYLMRQFASGTSSYRELSQELGIPMRTIGVRLWRARRKVRSLLEASPAIRSAAF